MKATFENFALTSKHVGAKPATWGTHKHTHHIVYVQNLDNKKRTSFDFWASIAQPTMESEKDLLYAFLCFLDDAICGRYTVEDFFAELGYENPTEGFAAYRACQRAADKLDRLYDGEVYDLVNRLREYLDE